MNNDISLSNKSQVFYVPQRPKLKPMNLPATFNKEKNERARVKVYKKEEKKRKKEKKLEGLKISTRNISDVRSLSQKLRDIEPVKPRTYYKAVGELNSGNMSSMRF